MDLKKRGVPLPEHSEFIANVAAYAIVREIGFFEAMDVLKKARENYGPMAADIDLAFQMEVVKAKNTKRK